MKEYPYWWDTVPALQLRPGSAAPSTFHAESAAASRFDVVIVGAGYTGLAAGRQLARSGASVLIVDREQVGWGASSRNGGQVLTGLKVDPATLVARSCAWSPAVSAMWKAPYATSSRNRSTST